MPKTHWIWLISALSLFASCEEEPIFYPKPRTYPRVDFPARKIVQLDTSFCAFTFRYPDYMVFRQDTQFLTQNSKHPCWFNLEIPALNGNIHFTYTDIRANDPQTRQQNFYKVYKDAYKLADEHDKKASGSDDLLINRPEKKVYGVLFNIEGHVASPFQFVLTDSAQHAVRASLYFTSPPNPDSMQAVIEFVKYDMMEILNSFEWKGELAAPK